MFCPYRRSNLIVHFDRKPIEDPAPPPEREPAPAPIARPPAPPAPAQIEDPRSPLQNVAIPPAPAPHEIDMGLRRRKLPASSPSPPQAIPSSSIAAGKRPMVGTSRFFAGLGQDNGKGKDKERERDIGRELGLSPHRPSPLFVPDSDEERESREMYMDMDMDMKRENIDKMPLDRSGDVGSEDEYWGNFADEEALLATLDVPSSSSVTASTNASRSRSAVDPATIQAGEEEVRAHIPEPTTVIYISDTDEKENVPVPTRRVKRRRIPAPDPDEIIELSSD